MQRNLPTILEENPTSQVTFISASNIPISRYAREKCFNTELKTKHNRNDLINGRISTMAHKCKLRDDQKTKINVDTTQDHLLPQDQKMLY